MKLKMLLLLLAVFVCISVNAQTLSASKVPASVKNAFKAKFKGATSVKWEMDNENYQAEFKIKDVVQSASFDKDGAWVQTENKIKSSDVPKEVKQGVKKEFDGYKITETEKVEHTTYGTCYQLKLAKKDEMYSVLFSASGEVLDKAPVQAEDTKAKK